MQLHHDQRSPSGRSLARGTRQTCGLYPLSNYYDQLTFNRNARDFGRDLQRALHEFMHAERGQLSKTTAVTMLRCSNDWSRTQLQLNSLITI